MKLPISNEERRRIRPAILVVSFTFLLGIVLYRFPAIWAFITKILNLCRPFFIGLAVAYIMNPIMMRLEKPALKFLFRGKHKKLCRALCALLSIVLLGAVITLVVRIMLPQLIDSIESIIKFVSNFLSRNSGRINQLLLKYDFISIDGEDVVVAWENIVSSQLRNITSLLGNVFDISSGIISFVYSLLVAVVTSFYMLKDKERLLCHCKKVSYAALPRRRAESLIYWSRRANHIFTGFLYGKLIDSLIVGLITYLCMLVFGWEYPVLTSVVIGVTNIIPFFGPFIGWAPCALIMLMINPMHALWFTVFILVLQQVDGNVIGPHILGDYTGLSALSIMIAIVIGSGLFGFTGMLLGVPVYALIYAIAKTFTNRSLRERGVTTKTETFANAPECFSGKTFRAKKRTSSEPEENK